MEKLEEWQQDFVSIVDENGYIGKYISVNVKVLYEFGNLILVFLTDFEFRKQITTELMYIEADYRTDTFDDVINQQFIQSKNKIVNWVDLSL